MADQSKSFLSLAGKPSCMGVFQAQFERFGKPRGTDPISYGFVSFKSGNGQERSGQLLMFNMTNMVNSKGASLLPVNQLLKCPCGTLCRWAFDISAAGGQLTCELKYEKRKCAEVMKYEWGQYRYKADKVCLQHSKDVCFYGHCQNCGRDVISDHEEHKELAELPSFYYFADTPFEGYESMGKGGLGIQHVRDNAVCYPEFIQENVDKWPHDQYGKSVFWNKGFDRFVWRGREYVRVGNCKEERWEQVTHSALSPNLVKQPTHFNMLPYHAQPHKMKPAAKPSKAANSIHAKSTLTFKAIHTHSMKDTEDKPDVYHRHYASSVVSNFSLSTTLDFPKSQ